MGSLKALTLLKDNPTILFFSILTHLLFKYEGDSGKHELIEPQTTVNAPGLQVTLSEDVGASAEHFETKSSVEEQIQENSFYCSPAPGCSSVEATELPKENRFVIGEKESKSTNSPQNSLGRCQQ